MVYVINKNGQALMPCKPAKAKHLLRDNKAVVVDLCPFTIQLCWDCESNVQEVIVGLDTGAVMVGCSATSNNKCLYASETNLRTDINKKMLQRAMYRRHRRARNTRYREVRYNNRTRPDGWLAPSIKSKVDSTVKVVKQLSKILPISKVVVEIAKFDTQKLQNPHISGVEYQRGVTADYDNLRAYVFERDNYLCQICKKKKGILQTHHIKQRKDGGADSPNNLITLHKDCHEQFHKGLIQHKFSKTKSYKMETQVTIIKDFIIKELQKDFNVETTYGYITKRNRMRLNLPKSHCFDAVAICNPKKVDRINLLHQRVCIPHGRYQLCKGSRGEQKLTTGKIFGYNQWDKIKIGNQIGFIKGRRSSGFFDVCDIDGKNISHSIKYTKLKKIYKENNMIEVMAILAN